MIEFDWLIHYRCNYRCPYCFFEGMWEEVERRNNYIPVDKWIRAWERIYKKYGEFKIIITGGEPFIYPGFIDLLTGLNRYAEIAFDTSLSCDQEVLEEFVAKIEPDRLSMGLSFHPLFADLDSFLKKIFFLKRYEFNFRIHYVTYPPQLSDLKIYKEIFIERGFRFVPTPFRGIYKGKNYPQAFTHKERECIYKVNAEINEIDSCWSNGQIEQVRSKNRLCYAGQYYVRVDNDGTIYPCGNYYTKSERKESLGNLFDENFQLNDKPMICQQETCPCEFRWLVDKKVIKDAE